MAKSVPLRLCPQPLAHGKRPLHITERVKTNTWSFTITMLSLPCFAILDNECPDCDSQLGPTHSTTSFVVFLRRFRPSSMSHTCLSLVTFPLFPPLCPNSNSLHLRCFFFFPSSLHCLFYPFSFQSLVERITSCLGNHT